jgi:hypothetical protein
MFFLLFLITASFVVITRFRIPSALAPIFSIACLTLFIFAGGIFGVSLKLLAWIIFWSLIAVFLINLILLMRQGELSVSFKKCVSPGMLVFLFFSVVGLIYFFQQCIGTLDEFHHWAQIPKEMFFTDTLPCETSRALHRYYLPGPGIIQFFAGLWGGYSEHLLYQVNFILLSSLAAAFFIEISWKDWQQLLLRLAFLWIIISNLGQGWHSLIADQLVAVTLFVVISGIIFFRTLPWFYFPIISLLTLFKQPGVWFCYLICLTLSLELILSRKSKGIAFATKLLLLNLLILFFSIAPFKMWGKWIDDHKIRSIFMSGPPYTYTVKQLIDHNLTDRQKFMLHHVIKGFLEERIGTVSAPTQERQFKIIGWLLLAGIFFATAFFISGREERIRLSGHLLILLMGLFLWGVGLIMFYLRCFAPATENPPIQRYFAVYLLPFFMIIAWLVFHQASQINGRKKWLILIPLLMLIILSPPRIHAAPKTIGEIKFAEARLYFDKLEKTLAGIPAEKVLCVMCQFNPLRTGMLGYYLANRKGIMSHEAAKELSAPDFPQKYSSCDLFIIACDSEENCQKVRMACPMLTGSQYDFFWILKWEDEKKDKLLVTGVR